MGPAAWGFQSLVLFQTEMKKGKEKTLLKDSCGQKPDLGFGPPGLVLALELEAFRGS